MMTKQDFAALANTIYNHKPLDTDRLGMEYWRSMCDIMASFCQTQNPQFVEKKFLDACGYYS